MAVRKIPDTARIDDVIAVVNQLVTLANELKADFNAHNHAYDDGGITEYSSKPNDGDTNAPTVAATTARTTAATDADSLAYRGTTTPT